MIKAFCVLCHPYNSLASNTEPLLTFSLLSRSMKQGGLSVLGLSGCTAFPFQSHAQQVVVLPILLMFFILKEHRKENG